MKRQEELNDAWYKEMGKGSVAIMQALAFALRWCDQHPHWISVEDELPPQGECVLVTDGKSYWQNLYSHKEKGWMINDTSVTHWMHLPSVEHLKDKK
jgi:hypothetical protein